MLTKKRYDALTRSRVILIAEKSSVPHEAARVEYYAEAIRLLDIVLRQHELGESTKRGLDEFCTFASMLDVRVDGIC